MGFEMKLSQPKKHTMLQANWISQGADAFLEEMAIGRTLNVCCGMSSVGDVRLDTDPKANRTEYGDLFNLQYPPRSFDSVICDPPFSYFNKFKWVLRLSDLADKRFIISGPLMNICLPKKNWKRRLFYDSASRSPTTGGRRLFLRLWWVFDRLNRQLVK